MNCNRCGYPLNGNNICNNCGNGMNNQQMMPVPPKKNSTPIIITLVICIFAIVGCVLFLTMNNKDDNGNNDVVLTGKTMEYNGLKFTIPNEYSSYIDNNKLVIEKTNDWTIGVTIASGYYESGNPTLIKESFKNNGYNVLNYNKKTYNGIEYMIFELEVNNYNCLIAYAKASSNQIYAIAVINGDNSLSHRGFEALSPILKSAKQSSYTNSIKVEGRISDLNAIEYFMTE